MKSTQTFGLFLFLAIMVIVLPLHHANSQSQTNGEKFFMTMKIQNPTETTPNYIHYQVTNITTNMENFDQNGTVQYDLADVDVTISDTDIYWTLPFKIIDTFTPNIIKTRNGDIGINSYTQDYEKQFNTLTNVTSFTGKSSLWINSQRITDLDLKAVVFPNGTGALEMMDSQNQTGNL